MEEGGTLAINSNIIHGNTVSGGDLNGLPPHGAALWLETKEANLSVTANSITGHSGNSLIYIYCYQGFGASCDGTFSLTVATINDNNVSNNATTYWIFDNQRAESDTVNAESNWLGTTIEAEIQVKIFDSNDDITKGTVDYVPFLTSPSTSPPPSPPTNLTGEASGTSASLFWAANPEGEITGYQVYYDTDSTGNPYDGTGGLRVFRPLTWAMSPHSPSPA